MPNANTISKTEPYLCNFKAFSASIIQIIMFKNKLPPCEITTNTQLIKVLTILSLIKRIAIFNMLAK